jgi:Ti-type conjugative transfer relaxase TraA
MANYHGTMKAISRQGGKSCVAALAYRSAGKFHDLQTGDVFDYTNKEHVDHVEILYPKESPAWILELAEECKTSRISALQKLSNVFEAAEKRKDSQVYREFEFSLPNELIHEQNIKWVSEFVQNVFVEKGMVAITNFHFDVDKKTGMNKPHCHVLLSTRSLEEDGFGLKQREWNSKNLVMEAREQYAAYQNFALKEHGFETRVDHRSYEDRGLDIEGQPKLGSAILDMAKRGFKLDKLENFNAIKLKNQFKILKNPELVFSIVTSNHSTFTRHDIVRVLNRYIDDADQFREMQDRLLGSNHLVQLEAKKGKEPIYTTDEILRVELGLVNTAERMSVQQTHPVSDEVIKGVIIKQNENLVEYGGLSSDQAGAIRHMLSGEQISCVVGYAGAGKTTSLEAAKEAWEVSGYKVIGLAPTGKAAREIEDCGIRSMTIHKFLLAQSQGREQLSEKSVLVLDEAGMVDSRRFAGLLSVVEKAGAKIVPMGDGNQLQSVEAGPAFRLLTQRVEPAVLETIVRQREDWQREATRLFGSQQASKALALYLEKGAFKIIEEKSHLLDGTEESSTYSYSLPEDTNSLKINSQDPPNSRPLVDTYCLARQMSGRIWKEMVADYEQTHGKKTFEDIKFEHLSQHQDYGLYEAWKKARYKAVGLLVKGFEAHKEELSSRGVNVEAFGKLVEDYKHSQEGKDPIPSETLKNIDGMLRQMSYSHLVDTRQQAKVELVAAWMHDRTAMPDQSHLMLSFTNKDALSLNESARHFMRKEGIIKGQNFTYETHSIDKDDFGKDIITKHERSFAVGDRLLFTSNNTGLRVKNGTLGTIVSLDQHKIRVTLDDKENSEVSFAPKLYPYIDNGWATNIHKSQGVTVDHVKKLASFEEYRNLAYVGMSRHRHSLEIFGSNLDFWREEKVIDRLSRVQEKLSGFDYLDANEIEDLIKEDAKALWYEQKIQEGKDLWGAIKGTAKSAVYQLLDRPKDSVTVDPLNGFEHSEEKRSSRLFKETTEHTPQLDHATSPTVVKDSSSKDVFEDRLKVAQDKINETYELKTFTREKLLSFKEAESQLKEKIADLATDLLGNPTSRTSTQLRFGKKGSVCVFTNGPKRGLYANYESGVYRGPLKLIEDQVRLSSPTDALKWASDWLGGNPLVIEQRVIQKQPQEEKSSTWTPVIPVPGHIESPDIASDKYLKYMLKDGSKETHRHAYRDEQGNLKGYIFRIEKADGSKITPPLAWCENEDGFRAWKWQGFEKESKTPYGIEKLAQDPTKPILVVEGEKTADAAQKLLPEYHVLTWSGGAGNVSKTNWNCLLDREVVIWPDNDAGGIRAAESLQKIVNSLKVEGRLPVEVQFPTEGQRYTEKDLQGSIGIVSLPEGLPEKWDLADKLPEGWTPKTAKTMISDAIPSKDIKAVHIQKEIMADINIEKAADQFIDLCVRYDNTPWGESGEKELSKGIEIMAGQYMHNEEFRQRIAFSKNDITIQRFQIEMEEQMPILKDTQTSEISNEASQLQDDSSDHTISTAHTVDHEIEKAAKEFIDLCVFYENMSWDDPRDKQTLRNIEAFAKKYMHNEEFRQNIVASKNEVAIERFQNEIEEQMRKNISQSMSRGI